MDPQAFAFSLISSYRVPAFLTSVSTNAPNHVPSGTCGTSHAPPIDWRRDDYQKHPCRFVRIAGARRAADAQLKAIATESLIVRSIATTSSLASNIVGPPVHSPTANFMFVPPPRLRMPKLVSSAAISKWHTTSGQHTCRLLRIIGKRKRTGSAWRKSTTLPRPTLEISNLFVKVFNDIVKDSKPLIPFVTPPLYPPLLSLKPNRDSVPDFSLPEKRYAPSADAQRWRTSRDHGKVYRVVDSCDSVPNAHQARRRTIEDHNECLKRPRNAIAFNRPCPSLKAPGEDQTHRILPYVPPSALGSFTPDSDPTLAYYATYHQAVPTVSTRRMPLESIPSFSAPPHVELCPPTPPLSFPLTSDSFSSTSKYSSSFVLTPVTDSNELQPEVYFERMALQIRDLRSKLEEIIAYGKLMVETEDEAEAMRGY